MPARYADVDDTSDALWIAPAAMPQEGGFARSNQKGGREQQIKVACETCSEYGWCDEARGMAEEVIAKGEQKDGDGMQRGLVRLSEEGHHVLPSAWSPYVERAAEVNDVTNMMQQLAEQGILPDREAATLSMRRLCAQEHKEPARELLQWLYQNKILPEQSGIEALVSLLGKVGDAEAAMKVIDLHERNGKRFLGDLYKVLVKSLADHHMAEKAEKVVEMMAADSYSLERVAFAGRSGHKLRPRLDNYMPIMRSYADQGKVGEAQNLLGRMKWRGIKPTQRLFNMAIKAASRAGNPTAALSILRELEGGGSYDVEALGIAPDPVSYATAMDCLAQRGDKQAVEEVLARMESKGVKPDVHTWGVVIKAHSYAEDPSGAEAKLDEMVEEGYEPSEQCFSTVVAAYCFVGDLDNAWRLVQRMKREGKSPNVVTYSHLIWGYGKYGEAPSSARVLRDMAEFGVNPDNSIIRTTVRNAYIGNNFSESYADAVLGKAVTLHWAKHQRPLADDASHSTSSHPSSVKQPTTAAGSRAQLAPQYRPRARPASQSRSRLPHRIGLFSRPVALALT